MEYEVDPNELLSTEVVRAVCAVEGCKPLELPPLAYVIDPDALDLLFTTNGYGQSRMGGQLSFIYSQSRVTIEHGEYLTIQPLRDAAMCPR